MAAKRGVDKVGLVVFSAMALGTAGMGTWQLQRYQWKIGLVEERKRKLNADPVPLGYSKADHSDFERVRCKGQYDYAKSMLVGPRHAPKNSAADSGSIGQSGYVVVTPFHDVNSGRSILVNRGWVGRNRTDLAFAAEKTPGTIEEFDAVISETEFAGAFTPPEDKKTGIFFMLDCPKMAQNAGLPDPDKTYMVERVDGQGPLACRSTDSMLEFRVHPAQHLGYAATWYGLCTGGLFMIKKRFL